MKDAPRGSPPQRVGPLKQEEPYNFTTDMKKLGLISAIKDGQNSVKKLVIKKRHISPPPPVLPDSMENSTQSSVATKVGINTKK